MDIASAFALKSRHRIRNFALHARRQWFSPFLSLFIVYPCACMKWGEGVSEGEPIDVERKLTPHLSSLEIRNCIAGW
jgi:hypothetical protein